MLSRREFLYFVGESVKACSLAMLAPQSLLLPGAEDTSARQTPEKLDLFPQERGFIVPDDLPVYLIPMERSGIFDRNRPVRSFHLSGGVYGYHGIVRVPAGYSSALEWCYLDHFTGLPAAAMAMISEGKYTSGKYTPETTRYTVKTTAPLYQGYVGGLDYYSPEDIRGLRQTITSLLNWQQRDGGFKSRTPYSFYDIISPDEPIVSSGAGADAVAFALAQLVSSLGGQIIQSTPRPWYSPAWTPPYDQDLPPVSVTTDLPAADFRFTLPAGFIHAQVQHLTPVKTDTAQPVIWSLAFSPAKSLSGGGANPDLQNGLHLRDFTFLSLPATYVSAAEKLFLQEDVAPFAEDLIANPRLKAIAAISALINTYANTVSPLEAKINPAKKLGTWLTQTEWWREYTSTLTPSQMQGLQSAIRHLDRYTYVYPDANGVPQAAQCVGAVILLSQMPGGNETPPTITVDKASDLVPDEALNIKRGSIRDISHQGLRLQAGNLHPEDYQPGDLYVLYSGRFEHGRLVVNRNDPGHTGIIVAQKEVGGQIHHLTFEINRGGQGVGHLRGSYGHRFQSIVANSPLPAVRVINIHNING
ncbi:hypothetical protein HYU89_00055 [Candidatus Collierbacteria bacterium]|nr:hypothetical protein [Candidatus Collierbacteria bacterium]